MPLSPSALTRLQYQHQTIRELIRDLPESQLKKHPNPEKWSAFENIAHLARYQQVFLLRLERIQNEDAPAFDRYVADTDPDFPDCLSQSLNDLLSNLDTRRSGIMIKLEGMNETALARTGRHPRYGLLNVVQWTEFFLLHEAHHLYTIFMLICAS
jgi:hypothetical protein